VITQVLINLLQNAARFTSQGYVCLRCTLGLSNESGFEVMASFAVEDTGSGLSPEVRDSLFDLYKSMGGLGLGMHLTSRCVALLGDELRIESPWRPSGEPGTAFYFNVPTSISGAEEPESPPGGHSDGRSDIATVQSWAASTSGATTGACSSTPGTPVIAVGASVRPLQQPPHNEDFSLLTAAAGSQPSQPKELLIELVRAGPTSVNSSTASSTDSAGTAGPASAVAPPVGAQLAADVATPFEFEADQCVLVADDLLVNRKLLRRAFMTCFGENWSVEEARTAEEALQMAKERTYALIVVDEVFSEEPAAMRGSAAIQQLRESEITLGEPRRKIVACTGNTMLLLHAAGSELGPDLVWGKPMPSFLSGAMQLEISRLLK